MTTVTAHPAGETAPDPRVGDFLLTGLRSQGIVSWAIRTGSWLRRYEKPFRRFSFWQQVRKNTSLPLATALTYLLRNQTRAVRRTKTPRTFLKYFFALWTIHLEQNRRYTGSKTLNQRRLSANISRKSPKNIQGV